MRPMFLFWKTDRVHKTIDGIFVAKFVNSEIQQPLAHGANTTSRTGAKLE